MSATPSSSSLSSTGPPSTYRPVGIALAVGSGVLIGSSFVFKKKGLLASQAGHEAGKGVAYLKSVSATLFSSLRDTHDITANVVDGHDQYVHSLLLKNATQCTFFKVMICGELCNFGGGRFSSFSMLFLLLIIVNKAYAFVEAILVVRFHPLSSSYPSPTSTCTRLHSVPSQSSSVPSYPTSSSRKP